MTDAYVALAPADAARLEISHGERWTQWGACGGRLNS